MKIGLFFGSYNPIHIGHMIIANHLAEFTDLEEIWLVLTPHNPFKKKRSLLADHHRYRMVEEATEDYPKLRPSNIEFKLKQPNYTIHTLAHLGEKYPEHQFNLIMGQDNLNSFHKWKNYQVILENHEIYVYPRVTETTKKPELLERPNIHFVEAPIVEISSTFIRQAVKEKKNVKVLLPYRTWKYMDEMNFYRT